MVNKNNIKCELLVRDVHVSLCLIFCGLRLLPAECCMLQPHNDISNAVTAALLLSNNVTINFHLCRDLTLLTKAPACGEILIMSESFPLICSAMRH